RYCCWFALLLVVLGYESKAVRAAILLCRHVSKLARLIKVGNFTIYRIIGNFESQRIGIRIVGREHDLDGMIFFSCYGLGEGNGLGIGIVIAGFAVCLVIFIFFVIGGDNKN